MTSVSASAAPAGARHPTTAATLRALIRRFMRTPPTQARPTIAPEEICQSRSRRGGPRFVTEVLESKVPQPVVVKSRLHVPPPATLRGAALCARPHPQILRVFHHLGGPDGGVPRGGGAHRRALRDE